MARAYSIPCDFFSADGSTAVALVTVEARSGEAEVVEVREDTPAGVERPDLIEEAAEALTAGWFDERLWQSME